MLIATRGSVRRALVVVGCALSLPASAAPTPTDGDPARSAPTTDEAPVAASFGVEDALVALAYHTQLPAVREAAAAAGVELEPVPSTFVLPSLTEAARRLARDDASMEVKLRALDTLDRAHPSVDVGPALAALLGAPADAKRFDADTPLGLHDASRKATHGVAVDLDTAANRWFATLRPLVVAGPHTDKHIGADGRVDGTFHVVIRRPIRALARAVDPAAWAACAPAQFRAVYRVDTRDGDVLWDSPGRPRRLEPAPLLGEAADGPVYEHVQFGGLGYVGMVTRVLLDTHSTGVVDGRSYRVDYALRPPAVRIELGGVHVVPGVDLDEGTLSLRTCDGDARCGPYDCGPPDVCLRATKALRYVTDSAAWRVTVANTIAFGLLDQLGGALADAAACDP